MGDFNTFNDPIYCDKAGSYITVGQLRFFLNRSEGRVQFLEGATEFLEYFATCATYNIISDVLREDPDSGSMTWDEKSRCIAFAFPANGKIARKIFSMGLDVPPPFFSDKEKRNRGRGLD